jgi:hypothetical protein
MKYRTTRQLSSNLPSCSALDCFSWPCKSPISQRARKDYLQSPESRGLVHQNFSFILFVCFAFKTHRQWRSHK